MVSARRELHDGHLRLEVRDATDGWLLWSVAEDIRSLFWPSAPPEDVQLEFEVAAADDISMTNWAWDGREKGQFWGVKLPNGSVVPLLGFSVEHEGGVRLLTVYVPPLADLGFGAGDEYAPAPPEPFFNPEDDG